MDNTKNLVEKILEEKMKRIEFLQKEIDKEFSRHWFIKIFTMWKIRKMMNEVDNHMNDFCNPDYLRKLYENNKAYIF